jgi:hypothetical protein
MKGHLGLFLLVMGLIVSASSGARNGERHVAYRHAEAAVSVASASERPDREAARDALGLPPPRQRLQEWFVVGGGGWLGGIALIVVGAVLSRMQIAEDDAGGTTSAGRVDFLATVGAVQAGLAVVREQIADLPMDADSTEPRAMLDQLTAEHIEPLVEGRGQLIARHGIGGFAEYFGTFSSAERNLNRCWSALTDGHTVVAREALVASERAFADAVRQYEEVDARG